MSCRLFQRLRKDYPNIFKVSRTFCNFHPPDDCFITFERVSHGTHMQVKQSEGQLESLALSEELDTPDKRTSALAGYEHPFTARMLLMRLAANAHTCLALSVSAYAPKSNIICENRRFPLIGIPSPAWGLGSEF